MRNGLKNLYDFYLLRCLHQATLRATSDLNPRSGPALLHVPRQAGVSVPGSIPQAVLPPPSSHLFPLLLLLPLLLSLPLLLPRFLLPPRPLLPLLHFQLPRYSESLKQSFDMILWLKNFLHYLFILLTSNKRGSYPACVAGNRFHRIIRYRDDQWLRSASLSRCKIKKHFYSDFFLLAIYFFYYLHPARISCEKISLSSHELTS